MAEEIRTERLLLRRATMADLAAMNRIMSNPREMRYWSTLPHENLAQTGAWLQSMVDADPATSDDFIVTRDGAVLGKFGAWRLPELGFLIDPEEWARAMPAKRWLALSRTVARSARPNSPPTSTRATRRHCGCSSATASPKPTARPAPSRSATSIAPVSICGWRYKAG